MNVRQATDVPLEEKLSRYDDEIGLVCRFCGAVFNTHFPHSPPATCYECGERNPWEWPKTPSYGAKIAGANQSSWEAFETRHEAVGRAVVLNRRNPDVDWFVSVDLVVK